APGMVRSRAAGRAARQGPEGGEADPRRQRRRIRMKMALIPMRKTVRAPAATGNGILGLRRRGDERGSRHAPADSTREGHRGKTREGTGQDEGPARAGEKTPRRSS